MTRNLPKPASDKIDKHGGVDWLIAQLTEGHSQRSIAISIGISPVTLHDYIARIAANDTSGERSARLEAARIAGAEAHEAEALRILTDTYNKLDREEPHPNASALATLARERAQASWRAASVRDPRKYHSSRGDINIDARTQQVKSLTIVGVPARGGVHRPINTGGSQEARVLSSNRTEIIESADFPAPPVKKDEDWLVVTNIPTLRDIK
jgi:hypothetical protein